MAESTVTIILEVKDAERFKEFQKYYELFNLLIEKKVFNQKGAAITLHFDIKGNLRTIARNDFLYSSNAIFDNVNSKDI
ncbi:MAG TPA: hypothetical protein VIY47_17375 [Ignavibacteriaceae bacterium]